MNYYLQKPNENYRTALVLFLLLIRRTDSSTQDGALPGRHFAVFFVFIPDLLQDFVLNLGGGPGGSFVGDVSSGQGDAVARAHPPGADKGSVLVGSRGEAEGFTLVGTSLPLQAGDDFEGLVEVFLAAKLPAFSAGKAQTVGLESVSVVGSVERSGGSRDTELLVGIAKGLEGVTHGGRDLSGVGVFGERDRSVVGDFKAVAVDFVGFQDAVEDDHGVSTDGHGERELVEEACEVRKGRKEGVK